jgi:hypothetical protein
MISMLLEACPTAKPAWDEHLQNWEGQEAGYYNDISVFAHHIVDSFKADKKSELEGFFSVLEKLLESGDEETKDLVSIGLLEDIQNIASWEKFGNRVFEPWLKPLTRRASDDIRAMWQGKSSLMDVVRAETEAKKKRDEKPG